MNDIDQSIAAAPRPHRPADEKSPPDQSGTEKLSPWARIRNLLTLRVPSLREDLSDALRESSGDTSGSFSPSERAILQNVLKLGDMRVEDVMVPRADIDAVEVNETMARLIEAFRAAAHSRLPVFEDNLDNIKGFVHIKDALQRVTEVKDANGAGPSIKFRSPVLRQKLSRLDITRKVIFVPPSMPVGDLLQSMQATRVHMSIVIDEYGGTDGLVTIEDLLEAVVGDIEDEHDEQDVNLITKEDENTFVADARVELAELRQVIGPDFDPGVAIVDVDTLGGLIFDLADRVPVRGEVITRLKGFEFEILAADPRRIRRVRIHRRKRGARPRVKNGSGQVAAE
jgi:CBS domain containing-hemolysin-like protein